ncbi:MAG: nucleotidyltransferase domain-containing protein [Gemmatimonadaceae bacterium]
MTLNHYLAIAMIDETTLSDWSAGPSAAEDQKCSNAESAVRRAVSTNATLAAGSVRVFTQGSYASKTNVRLDSDVDICVCRYSQFFYELPTIGAAPAAYGIVPVTISFSNYKTDVGAALVSELGNDSVKRGNKAFDVHANTYRVDADVVPAFEHRRYTGFDSRGLPLFHSGIKIISDSGEVIINWPQQTHENGIAKNNRTSRMYKRLIRILKRVRNEMQAKNVSEAENIASFLIECLVWNTPDNLLTQSTYSAALRNILLHTYNATLNQQACNEWGEVNELMYLFRDGVKPWTREQANAFIGAAWRHIGFG